MHSAPLKIELLYSPRCKSYLQMKTYLERALTQLGLSAELSLREINSKEEAQKQGLLGSPTVKVNGEDLEPGAKGIPHLA